MLIADGVYTETKHGRTRFQRTNGPEQQEQIELVHTISHRVTGFLEREGILVPSYRRPGINCVIFSERLDIDQLEEKSSKPINWPAWIKARKNK